MTQPIVIKAPTTLFVTDQNTRRLFLQIDDIASVPAELFKVKVSQSKNPDLAGKTMFKYITYKIDSNSSYAQLAPSGITIATPVEEIKEIFVSKVAPLTDATFSVAINMPGRFGRIATATGTFSLFDEEQFVETKGRPPYYMNSGTPCEVTLTEATSQHGPYYRINLRTDLPDSEVFTELRTTQVWSPGGGSVSAAPSAVSSDETW